MVVVCPFQNITEPQILPLHERILENFSEYGDRVALEDGDTGEQFTFSQVRQGSCSVAKVLLELGFKKGDVLAVFLENRPQYAMILLGVSAVGGVISGINPVYTAEEFQRQMMDSGAKFLLTRQEFLPKVYGAPHSKHFRHIFLHDQPNSAASGSSLPEDRRLLPMAELLKYKDVQDFPTVPVDPVNDVIFLPYSSGTTGLPKGVMLTHANLNYIFLGKANRPELSPFSVRGVDDVGVLILPFFHIAGYMGIIWSLTMGSKGVIMSKFDPVQFIETVAKHRATYLMVVPTILVFLCKHPMVEKYDLSSVKSLGVGSAPVGKELIHTLLKRFPGLSSVDQGYGMTESGGLISITPRMPLDQYLVGSCGIPSPGSEVKVVDLKDETNELGPNERGEIWVRSPAVMKGYINKEKATHDTVTKDGWLKTGDIGYYDVFGHFYVVDRLKELVKYKGFQVPPAELEDVLLKHEAVQEVGVTGIPHPTDFGIGELPTAFIVLRKGYAADDRTKTEISQFLAQHVAPYKQLRGGVHFLKEIPKGGTGKILRRKLKELISPSSKL